MLIHQRLDEPWTVAALAEEVAMSRSAFAARFAELVGETPVRYARAWKMRSAIQFMQEEGASIAELADRLGYGSEAAFSRAFKEAMGRSPSAYRRAAAG